MKVLRLCSTCALRVQLFSSLRRDRHSHQKIPFWFFGWIVRVACHSFCLVCALLTGRTDSHSLASSRQQPSITLTANDFVFIALLATQSALTHTHTHIRSRLILATGENLLHTHTPHTFGARMTPRLAPFALFRVFQRFLRVKNSRINSVAAYAIVSLPFGVQWNLKLERHIFLA